MWAAITSPTGFHVSPKLKNKFSHLATYPSLQHRRRIRFYGKHNSKRMRPHREINCENHTPQRITKPIQKRSEIWCKRLAFKNVCCPEMCERGGGWWVGVQMHSKMKPFALIGYNINSVGQYHAHI